MNTRQIIQQYLRANNFDGLAADGCGCRIDDLAPCGGDITECKPAKRYDCDGTCTGCESTGPHDRADACYRAEQIADEPEDTHL